MIVNRRSAMQMSAAGFISAMLPMPASSRNARQPASYLRTNWNTDPFALGAYSFLPAGVNQSTRQALESPIAGKVFFAGEATHPARNSTVHAAHESGIRAAKMVAESGHRRVAIIGAGMSGLTAAQNLSKLGHDVTVFEARDRIGGRIWTNRENGIALDLGASWIHGTDDNPLTNLSNQLGIERVATDVSYVMRGGDGRSIPDHAFPDWLQEVAEIQQTAGADAAELNLNAYQSQEDYEGDEVIFPDGYDQIFDALQGAYEIHLDTPVQSIKQDELAVSIQTSSKVEVFDATIVTLPLGVLKAETVRFEPPLPAAKRNAIQSLGMGLLDKIYLIYESPFWDLDATWILTPETGLPRGHFNQWLNLVPSLGLPVLVGFNGGTPARTLSALEDADLLAQATSVLAAAYPD